MPKTFELFQDNEDETDVSVPQGFHFPIRACLVGDSGSGKTNVVLNLLFKHLSKVLQHVVFVAGKDVTAQKVKKIYEKESPSFEMEIIRGFDEARIEEWVEEMEDKREPSVFVFEDLLSQNVSKKNSNNIIDRIVQNGRESNIGMMITAQRYSDLNPSTRANNCTMLFLFERPPDVKRLYDEQNVAIPLKEFEKILDAHTKEKYDFLVIDRTRPKGERLLDSDLSSISTGQSKHEMLKPKDSSEAQTETQTETQTATQTETQTETQPATQPATDAKSAKVKLKSVNRHSKSNAMKVTFSAGGQSFSIPFSHRNNVGQFEGSFYDPNVIASFLLQKGRSAKSNLEQYKNKFHL